MPFTISHAAAVLPFSRLLAPRRVLSAAVIGSMVPDFRVFFPWPLERVETHSALALLTFCLPVGLVTYWLFQLLIKTPVLEVLPDGAYARWRPFAARAQFTSVPQWLLAAGGVLAGAVTHLVWDAFTHEGARGVRMFPILDDPLIEIGRHHVGTVWLLQDLSSLFGLLAVMGFVAYGLRRGHETPPGDRLVPAAERWRWVLAYLISALAITGAFYWHARFGAAPTHFMVMRATEIAVAALRGLAAALVGVSLVLDLRLRALRYRSSGPER